MPTSLVVLLWHYISAFLAPVVLQSFPEIQYLDFRASMRRETSIAIYERTKLGRRWLRKKVKIPPLKKDGTLHLKDDWQGIFQLSWYEQRRKKWQNVKGRVKEDERPFLSDAIQQAKDKSTYLSDPLQQAVDQTPGPVTRKKVATEVA
jgi:hypothetical protein